jgi:S1-C subfamily serine protease
MRLPIVLASVGTALAVGAGGGAATYAVLSDGSTTTVVREVAAANTSSNAQPVAQSANLSVNEIYRRAGKGVVEITVAVGSNGSFPFDGQGSGQATGSGFVYDAQGHIVTNQHVVNGASSISVRFANGATYKATLVGSDASTDLAVIKVNAPRSVLAPIALADSDDVQVGDGVVAIGSPFGLEGTVTSGIVSALHRQMTAPNDFAIDDSIQTDAAINHGNSGGPLLNLHGKVIGVNAQIQSDSGGNEGVGFAIPSNTVRSIVRQLLATGNVQHAYLGVGLQTIPRSAAQALGIPAGAEITEVRNGTPAADAGLRGATGQRAVGGAQYPTGGDVVTAVNGKKIATTDDLRAAIEAKRPGDTISLTYTRDGSKHTVRITLASRPS